MNRIRTRARALLALGVSAAAVGAVALAPGAPLNQQASAKPPAPMAFCHTYPDAKACNTGFA